MQTFAYPKPVVCKTDYVRYIGEAEASLDGGPGVRLEKAGD
ncbi:MAG: hypothetical protein AAFX54_02910 [Pseudomonadota bacterium]